MRLVDRELQDIAARMLADYDAVTPGTVFAEGLRLELADAWRLQSLITDLREARGETVIGYKIGTLTADNQKLMGVSHPVWGRLWESELHGDGASLKKADYANIAIEAEFGVSLAKDVKPGQPIDEIIASIKAVYPLLELHNLVMRGEHPHGHELIANNCINAGVVRGTAVKDLDASREKTDLKLVYDGTTVDEWAGLRWPDDIVSGIGWLAGALVEHELELKAGDFILTGAFGPPIPVGDHTKVDVTSSAFGNVSATFSGGVATSVGLGRCR